MHVKEIMISNPTGLHARPASQFVAKAASYQSVITIKKLGDALDYNAKSIVMLLALGLAQGDTAILTAQGEDEEAAVTGLAELVANLTE